MRKDTEWLFVLRNKALAAIQEYKASEGNDGLRPSPAKSEETDSQLEIVGWRTRLIKRVDRRSAHTTPEGSKLSALGPVDFAMSPSVAPGWANVDSRSSLVNLASTATQMLPPFVDASEDDWVSLTVHPCDPDRFAHVQLQQLLDAPMGSQFFNSGYEVTVSYRTIDDRKS